ncbi:MAG: glycosyltransferase [Selenomonas sp.]|nr:glycosyltransferase [Selenomonas sp.]
MICVMMSTYNGEKYIYEQIDSIINQKAEDILLLIRDDGSVDRTKEIINSFIGNLPNKREIILLEGDNIGVERSFYELIYYAKRKIKKCQYYAFADQDDVWNENKLLVASKILGTMSYNDPNLYFSNLKVVDENLKFMGYKFKRGYVKNSKEFIVSEMCAWGCTCVFNYMALKEISRIQYSYFLAHDNWILWVCAFCGNLHYDYNSYILYRQHKDNASGQIVFGVKKILNDINKVCNISNMRPECELRAKLIFDMYNDKLSFADRNLIKKIAFYKKTPINRIKLLFDLNITSGHIRKEIGRRIRIMIGAI